MKAKSDESNQMPGYAIILSNAFESQMKAKPWDASLVQNCPLLSHESLMVKLLLLKLIGEKSTEITGTFASNRPVSDPDPFEL